MRGTFYREDAHSLAYALFRKKELDKKKPTNGPLDFAKLLDQGHRSRSHVATPFSNPDITYLVEKLQFKPRFIGKMIGWFGERVVVEALRRVADYEFNKEAYFVGVCRNVEKEG